MVTFKCKRGGNTVSFHESRVIDIEDMRKHEGYEEVKMNFTTPQIEKNYAIPSKKRSDPAQTTLAGI